MAKSGLLVIFLCICVLCSSESLLAQEKNAISAIPRVDVHSHVGSVERMEHYIKVGEALKEQYGINLAIWIDLNFMRQTGGMGEEYLDAADNRYQGRFLPCINDFKISDGLRYPPEELAKWQQKGVVGYKIWVGVSPLIDEPANDATFTKMEEIGMIGASVHISQPYPTKWCDDPVKFWEAHNAWERVLDRHPKLKVVNAHMLDHFNSDEQLDYLMYVLETYSNVHVDLGARFQQFNRMNRDKLRNFMISFLFGGDAELLETADEITRSFMDRHDHVGEAYTLAVNGLLKVRNEEFPSALEDLDRAASLSKGREMDVFAGMVHLLLQKIYSHQGDMSSAKTQGQRAKDLGVEIWQR